MVGQVVSVFVVCRHCGLGRVKCFVLIVVEVDLLCSSSVLCRYLAFRFYLHVISVRLYHAVCSNFLFSGLITT